MSNNDSNNRQSWIITIVVGLITAVIGPSVVEFIKKQPQPTPSPAPFSVEPSPTGDPTKQADVKITEPSAGASVEKATTVKGRYQNVLNDQKIWVVICSQTVNRCFPQDGSAQMYKNREWEYPSTFGNDNDPGKEFKIYVVLADKEQQAKFEEYLKTARGQPFPPGLEPLSQYADGPITVKRK